MLELFGSEMDGDDAEAWDTVGLEFGEVESPVEGPAEQEERRARLRQIDQDIQAAVPKVTAEEEAGYWASWSQECEENKLDDLALVLEALQILAEVGAARMRRVRVAKRGAQAAVELAKTEKAAKMAVQQVDLCEGEEPTKKWLDERSGAVALPRRRRRSTDPGLDADTVEVVKPREEQKWATEAQTVVNVLSENPDLPIQRRLRGLIGWQGQSVT
eukprot:s3417_g8.t2